MITLDGGRRRYQVLRHGVAVGAVEPPRWTTDGSMSIGDHTWTLTRSGREYAALGRSRLSALRSRWSVRWDVAGVGGSYELGAASGLGRQWRVLRRGVEIGRTDIRGFWTPKAAIALPDEVPPVDQVFLLWLVQDGIYRRTSAVATAAAPG